MLKKGTFMLGGTPIADFFVLQIADFIFGCLNYKHSFDGGDVENVLDYDIVTNIIYLYILIIY